MLRIPSPEGELRGPVVAGIDIGGTKITAVLADVDGNILASDTTASGRGGQALIKAAAGLVTRIETLFFEQIEVINCFRKPDDGDAQAAGAKKPVCRGRRNGQRGCRFFRRPGLAAGRQKSMLALRLKLRGAAATR